MRPNPALAALGHAPDDRLVILHADDVGMLHSPIADVERLLDTGTVTSASVMVACPWSRVATETLAPHPRADLGVHITLNAEWERYRWSAMTGLDPGGLTDAEGMLHRECDATWRLASPERVRAEVAAQLDTMLGWGVDVTHMDAHMGTAAHPRFALAAVEEALSRGVLPLFPRLDAEGWARVNALPWADAEAIARTGAELEESGMPLVDHVRGLPLDTDNAHRELLLAVIADVPAGITHLYFHPARSTAEVRDAVADWPARAENFSALDDPTLREDIEALGARLIGYRSLRDLLRPR